jgi:hypothetical protein
MRAATSGRAPVAETSMSRWKSVSVGPGCMVFTRRRKISKTPAPAAAELAAPPG